MAKPSIFSKDYERGMKKRKRRTFFSMIVIIAIVLGITFTNNGIGKKIKNNLNQIKEETKAEEEQKNKKQEQKKDNKTKNENKATVKKENKIPKDENSEIQLENNMKIKLIYIEDNNKNKILKSVDLNKNDLLYDINPSKNLTVVTNPKTQNVYLVNLNGDKQDITNKEYTSTSGTVFQKDSILSSKQDYLWGVSPKFIDNDNIAYVSQLPWFNKTTKYIWVYNIKNKNHLYTENISGEEIKFDKFTEKGLTVIADGKTLFLKPDGSIGQ